MWKKGGRPNSATDKSSGSSNSSRRSRVTVASSLVATGSQNKRKTRSLRTSFSLQPTAHSTTALGCWDSACRGGGKGGVSDINWLIFPTTARTSYASFNTSDTGGRDSCGDGMKWPCLIVWHFSILSCRLCFPLFISLLLRLSSFPLSLILCFGTGARRAAAETRALSHFKEVAALVASSFRQGAAIKAREKGRWRNWKHVLTITKQFPPSLPRNNHKRHNRSKLNFGLPLQFCFKYIFLVNFLPPHK